jgi:hypothetical protein
VTAHQVRLRAFPPPLLPWVPNHLAAAAGRWVVGSDSSSYQGITSALQLLIRVSVACAFFLVKATIVNARCIGWNILSTYDRRAAGQQICDIRHPQPPCLAPLQGMVLKIADTLTKVRR